MGEGEYRSVLEGLMSELGLRDCATLAGKLSHQDLLDLYRSCDVFAMPNREMPDGDTEGFGLVFLEANACGRAVIGGRAGGAVEACLLYTSYMPLYGMQATEQFLYFWLPNQLCIFAIGFIIFSCLLYTSRCL